MSSRSDRNAVRAQDLVDLRLVGPLAFVQVPQDQHAGQDELSAVETARSAGTDRDAPRWNDTVRGSAPVAAPITGMEGLRIVPSPIAAPLPTRAPWVIMHRLPIKAPSPMITGVALCGSSTPPMPTPPESVHTGADLRARSDRRPGVNHRVSRRRACTDVDVARHQDDAAIQKRTPGRRRSSRRRARLSPQSRA